MANPVVRLFPVVMIAMPAAMLLLLASAAAPAQAPATAPVATGASPAPPAPKPSAEAYYQWLSGCLDAIEKDLPAITASAEAAAKAYVQDGWEIGAWGDAGMVGEFNGRAGGLMRTSSPKDIEKSGWKGIVLFFPRAASWEQDFANAWEFQKQGKHVIAFVNLLRVPVFTDPKTPVPLAGEIQNHAALARGLFPASGSVGGEYVVPTDPVANIAATWTWTGEFVAALTRLGKMPAMHQSIMVPGAMQRMEKYKGLKFHADAPRKVEAGKLGREYLAELRKSLTAVHDQDMPRIVQVAEQAAATLKAGHKAHVFAHGHAIRYHVDVPHDPGYFHQVNRGLFELKADPGIAKGDFVFCVGYDRIFEGWYFHDATTRMRSAGATLAWSMTDYNNKMDANIAPSALPKGEIVIGQHWELGDAVVTVPGYDVKILPPSGVLAEAILYMTESQMLAILGPDSPAKYRAAKATTAPERKP